MGQNLQTATRPSNPAPLRGVLLDVDGTLVDSVDAHARAWAETFAEQGFDVPARLVRPLVGVGGDKLVRALVGLDPDDPAARRLEERRGELFRRRYLPHLVPLRGARDLVAELHRRGVRLVAASSAMEDDLRGLLERAQVADLVGMRTSADAADRSKPDPDIVCAALARARLRPDEAALIGDTPYDVEAAHRAGVLCVAVRSGGWQDGELTGAAAVYDDPADVLAHLDDPPLGPRLRAGSR